jgi:hypothetical protein
VSDQVSRPYKTDKTVVLYISIFIFLSSKLEDKRFYTEWLQAFPDFNLLLISSWIEFYIPCTKSHVPFPLLRSYQRSFQAQQNCIRLVKGQFLRWGVVSNSPKPQAGGTALGSCPLLLIQNIRSYPPY